MGLRRIATGQNTIGDALRKGAIWMDKDLFIYFFYIKAILFFFLSIFEFCSYRKDVKWCSTYARPGVALGVSLPEIVLF